VGVYWPLVCLALACGSGITALVCRRTLEDRLRLDSPASLRFLRWLRIPTVLLVVAQAAVAWPATLTTWRYTYQQTLEVMAPLPGGFSEYAGWAIDAVAVLTLMLVCCAIAVAVAGGASCRVMGRLSCAAGLAASALSLFSAQLSASDVYSGPAVDPSKALLAYRLAWVWAALAFAATVALSARVAATTTWLRASSAQVLVLAAVMPITYLLVGPVWLQVASVCLFSVAVASLWREFSWMPARILGWTAIVAVALFGIAVDGLWVACAASQVTGSVAVLPWCRRDDDPGLAGLSTLGFMAPGEVGSRRSGVIPRPWGSCRTRYWRRLQTTRSMRSGPSDEGTVACPTVCQCRSVCLEWG